VIDNSDGAGSSVLDPLHHIGFSRVDFYGYFPVILRPGCTSLFFRDSCFLLESSEPPADALFV
jgi:hypothetical protein